MISIAAPETFCGRRGQAAVAACPRTSSFGLTGGALGDLRQPHCGGERVEAALVVGIALVGMLVCARPLRRLRLLEIFEELLELFDGRGQTIDVLLVEPELPQHDLR